MDGTTRMHQEMLNLAGRARGLERLVRELAEAVTEARRGRTADGCYDPLGLARAHLEGEPRALAYLGGLHGEDWGETS